MIFTCDTLYSTSLQFSHALSAKGIPLSLGKLRDRWAQIVVGKNYSAAVAQAKADGWIPAISITPESISQKLRDRSVFVDASSALELFAESIGKDLQYLSNYFHFLVKMLQAKSNFYAIAVSGDALTGIGIVEPDVAGYIPLGQCQLAEIKEHECSWIKQHNHFVADVCNYLAGHSQEEVSTSFFANIRSGYDREDSVFLEFMTSHSESVSCAIALKLVTVFNLNRNDFTSAKFYFDEIDVVVASAIESEIQRNPENWLKIDCDLSDAVIDHVSARLMSNLRCFADPGFLDDTTPLEILESTASQAIKRILKRK